MNKKGFSLVELLAVIVILAIIMAIAVISYDKLIGGAKNKSYKNYEEAMESSTIMYIIDNGVPASGKITISELVSDRRIDYFNDPNSSSQCLDSYVEINKINGDSSDLAYKVCLICPDYRSDGC